MLFALGILLIRTIWCIGSNTTTIEGWEIERHEAVVRRARALGGVLYGADGKPMRIQKQEFPYDIGIWQNFRQGMGTSNVNSLTLRVLVITYVCTGSCMVLATSCHFELDEWT
jgi:hypothetical protein